MVVELNLSACGAENIVAWHGIFRAPEDALRAGNATAVTTWKPCHVA